MFARLARSLLLAGCAVAVIVAAGGLNEARGAGPVVLWPEGAPGALGKEPADVPTLTPYLPPKERATGAAVIVCPGGGYGRLAEHEGGPSRSG